MSKQSPQPIDDESSGVTRRTFFKASGLAVAGTSLGGFSYLNRQDGEYQDLEDIELEVEEIPTACWIGKQDCGMIARKVNGRVVSFQGNPNDGRTGGSMCVKGASQIAQMYNPYRVKTPLKRTNDKGEPGEWEAIGWDQAKQEISDRIQPLLEDDPRRVLFQSGRNKASMWHKGGFGGALSKKYGGILAPTRGGVCSHQNRHMNRELLGHVHVSRADVKNCEYLLAWGWGISASGGPHWCQIGGPREIIEAKENNDLKVVAIDPQRRQAGQFVDEWVPIKPGTDLALFLAFNHVLIREGYLDEKYLTQSTNAPCLVDDDGRIVRSADGEDPWESHEWTDGELVYDRATEEIVPHEEAEDPALKGTYTHEGTEVKPGFERYAEHVEDYTPEWAESKCGVPADQIEHVAIELGEHAKIGSTITIDGEELPYRPVALGAHNVAQQELGMPASQAMTQTFMLLGAIGVPGGLRGRSAAQGPTDQRASTNRVAFHPEEIADAPDGPELSGSKFVPAFQSGGYTVVPHALLNPDEFNLPYRAEEMAAFCQMVNPAASSAPQDKVIDAWSQFDTVVVVDPFLSETASFLGDYVLPAATAEKIEGPSTQSQSMERVNLARTGVMDPLFDSKPDGEIFVELADAFDVRDEYVETLNSGLGLDDDHRFTSFDEITVEEGIDRWARQRGKSFEWYRENGAETENLPVEARHSYLWESDDGRPYGGWKHYFYHEGMERVGEFMQENLDVERYPYAQDSNGFPTWRDPTAWDSPDEYDLSLATFKEMESKQTRTKNNALLNEISPRCHARIHTSTAEELGIEDGELVKVTSHNALTGKTRSVEARAMVLEGMRPDTVAMTTGHGNDAYPIAQSHNEGPNVNKLFPSGPGYMAFDNSHSWQVQVAIESIEGGE